ncbi:LLM class flavin-dependent oxidoreductase [Streptococcus ovuberis]|uniref:LLM class flavin-dependent oxidoreductase n=1 Tax=Streptococcus ovuberis TaxID=1936207 RepID=A0A7X6S1H3_9STRE|nr:LLM class flavin-dependent oxidoreductase [Streptococcus ovuberis]NKZ20807.1 LLM class flavin-dependent oxidoreductase [Streptococcus ovuberis]
MKLSVLNLAPLREGQDFKSAMDDVVILAQETERLGYERYWIAEHHNSKTIASSATQLLIQHTLAQTSSIRVGSGGVMLPNHSPYLISEQYGTLETLYPNRIDLGLGRAPGTDQQTARAIRRTNNLYPHFEEDILELQGYFKGTQAVQAYPAAGLDVPMYILGSSTDSAHLAAKLGLPYVFAAHFAPRMLTEAVSIYRREFQPSDKLSAPYVILCANVIMADTDNEANRLATSQTMSFAGIVTNRAEPLQAPKNSDEEIWSAILPSSEVPHFGPVGFSAQPNLDRIQQVVRQMTAVSLIGNKATVAQQLHSLKKEVHFDELMANSYIFDQKAQAYSYQLLSELVTKDR